MGIFNISSRSEKYCYVDKDGSLICKAVSPKGDYCIVKLGPDGSRMAKWTNEVLCKQLLEQRAMIEKKARLINIPQKVISDTFEDLEKISEEHE
jgi:hypothetical protein